MKKLIASGLKFFFVIMLLCYSGIPLIMASESSDSISGCVNEHPMGEHPDYNEKKNSHENCEHSEKLSLAIPLISATDKNEWTRFIASFFPILDFSFKYHPTSTLYAIEDSDLNSLPNSHRTIVLRI
jgi:hypothetical protein